MDKAQETEMLLNASVAAAILRVSERHVLIDLKDSPMPNREVAEWKSAQFIGCIALCDGRVRLSLDEDVSTIDLRVLSIEFARMASDKRKPPVTDDFEIFMCGLMKPDTRSDK